MRFNGPDANDLAAVTIGAYVANAPDMRGCNHATVDATNAAWERLCARHTQCTALMLLVEWARATKLT